MSLYNIVSPASLVPGQPEDVSQVLANFQAIQAVLNGGIDDVNIRSTAAIAPSKLAGYPSDVTKVLRGDGSWLGPMPNRITSSAISGGPPSSPNDGDIWIATGVDTGGTTWQFRYNAGSASTYKWEFIGGKPQGAQDTSFTVYSPSSVGAWQAISGASKPTLTTLRAGEYEFYTYGRITVPTGADLYATIYYGASASATAQNPYLFLQSGASQVRASLHVKGSTGVPANSTWNFAVFTDNAVTTQGIDNPGFALLPIRIS
jgi:hypothetical protein